MLSEHTCALCCLECSCIGRIYQFPVHHDACHLVLRMVAPSYAVTLAARLLCAALSVGSLFCLAYVLRIAILMPAAFEVLTLCLLATAIILYMIFWGYSLLVFWRLARDAQEEARCNAHDARAVATTTRARVTVVLLAISATVGTTMAAISGKHSTTGA